jgi:hypothetical protein
MFLGTSLQYNLIFKPVKSVEEQQTSMVEGKGMENTVKLC